MKHELKFPGGGGWWLALLAVGVALAASVALAQVPGGDAHAPATGASTQLSPDNRWPARNRGEGVPLAVFAQPQARPALQYALLPPMDETEKGNPSTKYLEAMAEMPVLKNEQYELIDDATSSAPLADLNESEQDLVDALGGYSYSLKLARGGARTDGMLDWENDLRTLGFRALLPSLGKYRQLTNVLALQIRFDIKRRDWAAAGDKLQTGFAMARHMCQGETLIENLVGVAIATRMATDLEDWVTQPGAPNLYWPLSNLPAPFTDMRRAMDFEHSDPFFSFPEMKELKSGHYSAEGWTRLISELKDISAEFDAGSPGSTAESLGAAAMGTMIYPQAKTYLIAHGTSAPEVEKMPVYEALERYFCLSWEDEADEVFKWNGLPAKEASLGMAAADQEIEALRRSGEGNMFAEMLIPSVDRARILAARLDRQIAALRIVEAIRSYAAQKGALPENLAALDLPVSADPVHEAPFNYALQDGSAILSSPAETPREGLRYVITLRK